MRSLFRHEGLPRLRGPEAAVAGYPNDQGKMKDVAFIKDPDGYWIEIVEPARLKGLGK